MKSIFGRTMSFTFVHDYRSWFTGWTSSAFRSIISRNLTNMQQYNVYTVINVLHLMIRTYYLLLAFAVVFPSVGIIFLQD